MFFRQRNASVVEGEVVSRGERRRGGGAVQDDRRVAGAAPEKQRNSRRGRQDLERRKGIR